MYAFATRGNARIRWEECDLGMFREQPLFLEAAHSGHVHTIVDLATFLSETDILSCPDEPCIRAFLEINRHLYNVEGRPRIFYAETLDYITEEFVDDTYTAYSVLEFSPQEDDVYMGFLRPDVLDDKRLIPARDVWVRASIKINLSILI